MRRAAPQGLTLNTPDADRFTPHPLLQHPHAQTILASLKIRRPSIRRRVQSLLIHSRVRRLETPDATLEAHVSPQPERPDAPLAVMLHGWEGSHESLYLMELSGHLFKAGFAVARLNLRDHGGTHALNAELFNSTRLREAVDAVVLLHRDIRPGALMLCGFSLGGNFALRIGAAAPDDLPLGAIAAICPLIDPVAAMPVMDSLAVYRGYFLRKWRRSLRAKSAAWPERYDFTEALPLRTITEMTHYFVRHYTDYPSAEDYLNGYAVTPAVLDGLRAPTHVLMARDDPVLPDESARLRRSDGPIDLLVTERGGHCGYLGSSAPPWFCHWALNRLRRHLYI